MLSANLISALPVSSSSGKLSATENAPTTNLLPGQQLQVTVQSKTSEGIYKVQGQDLTLQLHLSGNTKIGDTLRLEVLSVQPRITFGNIASTNPLSTAELIGSAARLLSDLAGRPIAEPIVQQLGSKPIWQAEQLDTKQLAVALRDALGKSGLFYESHQAQWVQGLRSTSELREEPQNILLTKGLPPQTSDLSIPKELVQLVQQQLHTLEQHHLVWMGQVWPGQQMQWAIQGQPERRQQDERQLSTEMELALPSLGEVHARLAFSASGLRITLRAADTATSELFDRALPSLRNALADAGISLVSAKVEKS
jgi:Flagellar hook-length control protein FliK